MRTFAVSLNELSVIKGSDEKKGGGEDSNSYVYVSPRLCPKFRLDNKLFLLMKFDSTLVLCVLHVIMVKAGTAWTDSAVQTTQYISQKIRLFKNTTQSLSLENMFRILQYPSSVQCFSSSNVLSCF